MKNKTSFYKNPILEGAKKGSVEAELPQNKKATLPSGSSKYSYSSYIRNEALSNLSNSSERLSKPAYYLDTLYNKGSFSMMDNPKVTSDKLKNAGWDNDFDFETNIMPVYYNSNGKILVLSPIKKDGSVLSPEELNKEAESIHNGYKDDKGIYVGTFDTENQAFNYVNRMFKLGERATSQNPDAGKNYYVEETEYSKYLRQQNKKQAEKNERIKNKTIDLENFQNSYGIGTNKEEYLKTRETNNSLPEYGSYDYLVQRENVLSQMLEGYLDDKHLITRSSMYNRNIKPSEMNDEQKREYNDFVNYRGMLQEYVKVCDILRDYEGNGLVFDDKGELDTISGSENSKKQLKRYNLITDLVAPLNNSAINADLGSKSVIDDVNAFYTNSKLADIEEDKVEAYEYYDKNKDNKYGGGLFGRIGANIRSGITDIKSNEAGFTSYDYKSDDIGASLIYEELDKKLRRENQAAYTNYNTFDAAVATVAAYLPQFYEQTKAQVKGMAVGGMIGVSIGNPRMGANIGGAIGSSLFMFEQTAGQKYVDYIKEGLPPEEAQDLAMNTALSTAAVEFGLEMAVSGVMKGFKGAKKAVAVKNITKSGVSKSVAKEMVEASLSRNSITQKFTQKLINAGISERASKVIMNSARKAGQMALSSFGEGIEEFLQTGMEITADKFAKEGKSASVIDIFRASLDFGNYTEEELLQMDQSFLAGAFLGGFANIKGVGNSAIGKLINVVNDIVIGNEIINSKDSDVTIEGLINFGLESENEKTVALAKNIADSKNVKAKSGEIGKLAKNIALENENARTDFYSSLYDTFKSRANRGVYFYDGQLLFKNTDKPTVSAAMKQVYDSKGQKLSSVEAAESVKNFNDMKNKLTGEQRKVLAFASRLTNGNIIISNSNLDAVNNKFGLNETDATSGNGFYDSGADSIVLNFDEISSAEYILNAVLTHEMTHSAESSKYYKNLADFVLTSSFGNINSEDGKRLLSEAASEKVNQYKSKGKNLTPEGAIGEIVAQKLAEMLNDPETGYSALKELASRDLTTAKGVLNSIKATFERIKNKLTHNEGRYYGKYVNLTQQEQAIKLFEKAVRDGAKNKGPVINSNQNSNDVSFSFEGVTKGGIRIYKTDFPIGTSKKTKQTLFENRVATIFNLGAVTLNTSTKKIEIKGDMFTAEKNLYGDKEASKKEMKAKLNSLYDLADILATSNFKKVKPEDSYINPNIKPKNKAHKGVKYWYKFENRIYLDGDLYDVTFNIRDKGKEQYEYLVEFKDLKKKMTPVGNTVQNRPPANYRASSSKGMVSQNKPVVNGNNSGNPTNNTQNDFTDYSQYKSNDNSNVAVMDKPTDAENKSGAVDNQNNEIDNNPLEFRTKKSENYYNKAVNTFRKSLSSAFNITNLKADSRVNEIIKAITEKQIKNGKIDTKDIDTLFDELYSKRRQFLQALNEEYTPLKEYFRKIRFYISDVDAASIPNFETYLRDYVKNLFTVTNDKESGFDIKDEYRKLKGKYPNLFKTQETEPADMLMSVAEVANEIKRIEKECFLYDSADEIIYKSTMRMDMDRIINEFSNRLTTLYRYENDTTVSPVEAPDIVLRGAIGENATNINRLVWSHNVPEDGIPNTAEIIKEKDSKANNNRIEMTEDELISLYNEKQELQKKYEKVEKDILLSDKDKYYLEGLVRGTITEAEIPKTANVGGIKALYQAKASVDYIDRSIERYNAIRKEKMEATANKLLENSDNWKEKKSGFAYGRETMERNIRDMVKDKATADAIIDEYFTPVHHNEAERTRFKNKMRGLVKKLNISEKVVRGDKVSENFAVQFLGELNGDISYLENKKRLTEKDRSRLEELKAQREQFLEDNPSFQNEEKMKKVERAIRNARRIYDYLFDEMNRVRVRNGYSPVEYRHNYFPHFITEEADGILGQMAKAIGINMDVTELPTNIAGKTQNFKPGIRYFKNAQRRWGIKTDFEFLQGFDKYIEGVSDVIYHTDDIQRLRSLETALSEKYSEKGVEDEIKALEEDTTLDSKEKYQRIKDLVEKDLTKFGGFAMELREYTNLLANKKSRFDRNAETFWRRHAYNVFNAINRNVAVNMIAGNISSAFTNFIPLAQAKAECSARSLIKAANETVSSYAHDDHLVNMSDFLTNRFGSEKITKTKTEKFNDALMTPMSLVDNFTSQVIWRAKYHDSIKKGMSASQAIKTADSFAAGLLADRSKGAMPTIFSARNIIAKSLTMFQVEVNNQYSYLFKDLRNANEKKRELAAALMWYFLSAYLFNDLYEKVTGRRPAFDPAGMANDFAGNTFGKKMPNTVDMLNSIMSGEKIDFDTNKKKAKGGGLIGLVEDVTENLPFIGGLLGGGRVPISSGIPFADDPQSIIDAFAPGTAKERRNQILSDELPKLAYSVLPYGGAGQAIKTIKGISTVNKGGKYTYNSKGEKQLQYPVHNDTVEESNRNYVQAALFGRNALPTAQDWVKNEFDTMSAKDTARFDMLKENGNKSKLSYNTVMEISALPKAEYKEQHDYIESSILPRKSKTDLQITYLSKDKKEKFDEATKAGISDEFFIDTNYKFEYEKHHSLLPEKDQKAFIKLKDKKSSATLKRAYLVTNETLTPEQRLAMDRILINDDTKKTVEDYSDLGHFYYSELSDAQQKKLPYAQQVIDIDVRSYYYWWKKTSGLKGKKYEKIAQLQDMGMDARTANLWYEYVLK